MLEGKLGDFSLPDIFQLIALTKKSGALRVSSDQQEGRVLFKGGEVCFAVADVRRLAMGARLVSAGLVDEDQITKVLEAQKEDGSGGVLQALLADAAVDEGSLDAFVREQIEDAVFDLMRLDEASFTFDAVEGEEADSTVGLTVSTEHLVMEGGRRLGEWASIREQIPSPEAVLELSPAAVDDDGTVSIPAEQWRVMALVDGKRTVAEIVDLHGQGEFATSKLLCSLVSAGLVELTDTTGGKPGALSKLLERRDLLRRLEEMELGAPAKPAPKVEAKPEVKVEKKVEVKPTPAVAPPAEPKADKPVPPVNPPAEPKFAEPKPEPEPVPVPAPAAETPKAEEPAQVPAESVKDEAAKDEPAKPAAEVDRSQVARELASLGLSDDLPTGKPAATANGTPANGTAAANAANANGNGAKSAEEATEQKPEGHRTLTRDEDVNKGLLLRLIDGVKGA